jgi:membrane protease YdiL (CAAX protease family)
VLTQTDIADPARHELSRIGQFFEVLVFLALIVPSMALSFFAIRQGSLSFVLTAWATILRDLALVSLVAYFLWRNREPLSRIGWIFRDARWEVALGGALFIVMSVVSGFAEQIFQRMGLSAPAAAVPKSLTAAGPLQFVLAVALVLVVAVAEETIFRGYLILRFTGITGSRAAAVLLSSIVFALGHGYEGTAGVATVGLMGLMLALVYVWRQSLVAPIVMHCLQDLLGIVILPLLGHR